MKRHAFYSQKLKKSLLKYYPGCLFGRGSLLLDKQRTLTFDDPFTLRKINKIFEKYRNYPFITPKKGEPIIFIASGGLDSISNIFLLLEKYKTKVFVIHFVEKKGEKNSMDFFSNFFLKKYPRQYIETKYFKEKYIFQFNDKAYRVFAKDPNFFIPNLLETNKNNYNFFMNRYPLSIYLEALRAVEYALWLQTNRKIRIRTILRGSLPEDGYHSRRATLTTYRAINLAICHMLGDFTFQFSSISIEKDFDHFYTISDLIKFAHHHGVPLEKTYSCDLDKEYHCGKCISCQDRKAKFKIAKVEDHTVYQTS